MLSEIRELRKAAQKQAAEMDKMLAKFKAAMEEKQKHDLEYQAMKDKFSGLTKQINEKD